MPLIEANCREVCEATEIVALVTSGPEGPHVVGNWGDYMRTLGIDADTIGGPCRGSESAAIGRIAAS